MFICNRCGETLEELPLRKEYIGDEGQYEVVRDPECKCGGMYEEAKTCKRCGDPYPESEEDHGMCGKCQRELMDMFRDLMAEFTPEERQYIYDTWRME